MFQPISPTNEVMNPQQPEQEGTRTNKWTRYIVPLRSASSETSLPVTVFAPPNDPAKAAVVASIVAFLGKAGIGP